MAEMPSEPTASNEQLAHDLTEVKVTFRTLQSELVRCPIWHWLDRPGEVRSVVSVVTCHAAHLMQTRLKPRGLSLNWQLIRGHPAT